MIRFVIVWMLVLLLAGCRTVTEVREVVRTDTTYINKVQRDSIYARDSIYVRDKGDTIVIVKTQYRYRDKAVHDTVYRYRVDTVRVQVPVERELTRWQSLQIYAGRVLLIGVLILVIYSIYKVGR